MKISQPRSKKIIVIPIVALVVIGITGGIVFAVQRPSQPELVEKKQSATVVPQNTTNYSPPTNQETQAGQSAKQDTITKTDSGSATATEQSSNISLSAAVNGDTIRVIANLSGIKTAATCALTLSKNATTITKDDVGIQALPSYSTCKGWSFPASELSSGDWTVKVTVTDGQGVQQSSTTKVTVS